MQDRSPEWPSKEILSVCGTALKMQKLRWVDLPPGNLNLDTCTIHRGSKSLTQVATLDGRSETVSFQVGAGEVTGNPLFQVGRRPSSVVRHRQGSG